MTNEQVEVKLLTDKNNHAKISSDIETISLDNTIDVDNNNSGLNYSKK